LETAIRSSNSKKTPKEFQTAVGLSIRSVQKFLYQKHPEVKGALRNNYVIKKREER
jgi:hypothetical protein